MKWLPTLVAATAFTAFAASPSVAGLVRATGSLNGPADGTNSPGIGTVFVELDTGANTLHVQSTFSGLVPLTSAGAPSGTTNAHIHCCTTTPFTGTVGVATTLPSFVGFPLGVTAGSFDQTYDLRLASSYNPAFITARGGIANAEQALFFGIASGAAYFNIHTNAFPGGEIRSFLTPTLIVPEPASLALVLGGLGLASVAAGRRRRSAG